MNKVFKVIWNHATQTWVAVSEFSKAKGKTKSKTLTTISLAVGSVLVGSQASAAVYVNNQEVTTHGSKTAIVIATGTSSNVANMINTTTKSIDHFIRIGQAGAPVVRDGSIVIGFQVNDQSTGEAGDVIIGNYAQVGGGGADSLSTSVGYHTQVAGPSVAMGVGARSDILDANGWLAVHNGGVAIGSFALQGGNRNGGTVVGGLATGDYHFSTTIGAQAGAIGLIDNRAINKHHGFAVNEAGDPAPINGRIGMTSIGYQAAARGTESTAIGRGATTGITGTRNGASATAVGHNARAFKNHALALGERAIAGGLTTGELTALDAELTRLNGLLATAEQEKTTATNALKANPTAENKFAVASAEAAKKRIELAISRATEDKKYAANASTNTEAAIAIGYSAIANHANTTAIGRATAAYASGSLALGRAAGVTGVNSSTSMAIGDAALISGDAAADSIAVGHSANIKQNSSHAIAIGANASVVGDANGSSGSIAIGHNTAAGNKKVEWRKNSSRELGYLAAQNATAVGTDSIAGGTNSTTFGYKNVVQAPNSGALGFNNTVGNYSNPTYNNNVASANYNGIDSFVVGANNNVTANNTVVFGNNVTVNSQGTNRTGAVVLGDNSTVPTDVKAVNSAKIGTTDGSKLVYSGFAGNLDGTDTDGNPLAAADKQGRFVSVGNATSPRQVKFVAAGEISKTSTDAINGSQLYAFSGVVNNLATSAATIIGGGATLNQNGTLENFSQPLNTTGLAGAAYTKPTTAANNIATAITNLNNYVNAGWKIAQGDDTAAKARISPDEQVNFKADGLASVTVTANGTGAEVTYNVEKGEFNATTTDGTISAKVGKGNKAATVEDVSDAINRAYWTAKAAGNDADGNKITNDTPDQVTAGTEVTFEAGKNLAVTHTTNKFEFKTKDEVEFTSVQIGTDGPKLTNDGNTLKVSAADGSAPVKITNVEAGDNDNDAVNYKQLREVKAATDNTIKLSASNNVKGTTVGKATETDTQTLSKAGGVNFKLVSADDDLLSVKAAGDTVTFTPKLGKVEVTGGKAVNATSQTGLVEATSLTEALNKLGWKTKATVAGSTAATDQEINAGDSVNYEDGQGTTAKVEITKGTTNPDTGISKPDTVSVKYDVKAADDTIKVSDTGVKVNTGAITAATDTVGDANRGKVTVATDEGNKVATVQNVADAINSAATIIKAHNDNTEITDEIKDDKGETVKAGEDVTYTAGKNLRVKRDAHNLTFALANDITVNSANVETTLSIGKGDATSPKVNITSTTSGLDMGNAVLTNVASGINTYPAGTTPVTTAKSGLADLANSTSTNVVTVADAAKLGWVVSADKTTTDATTGTANANAYAANVTTANEVKFVGKGYATVSGATDSNGVRTITVSVGQVGAGQINADGSVTETSAGLLTAEEGTKLINGAGWLTNVTNATTGLTETKVVTPGTQVNYVDGNGTTANVIKNTVGGKEVVSVSYDVKAGANTIAFNKDGDELVKVGDKYYKVADVVDGKPTNNAVAVETADIATADNRTPYENALNGLVNLTSSVQSNAMTVADAARMGWVVSTSANDYSANVTNTKEVNFVGLGAVDVSGSNVDEIRNINVSVDLPVDYTETTITENGQEVDVVKLSDGKWYKVSDLNDQGEPKDDAVAVDTKVTPISKKGAVLSDASSSLNNNPYKAKEYTYDDVNQTVTPKTYAELLAADPNFNKDEIKEGTNGVKLNNVGWAEAPDQAVNLDQLNQTVYKSGFYVKQNGVDTKGTNSAEDSATEKVTPEDVVNFVNGKNTVLKATTTRNAQTGQDTTNVTVDVDLPVVYTDAEGAKVVKVGDKYYYAEDVENGKLKNGVDADNDAVTNVVASMNNVASDDDTAGNNVVLRNVAEGTKTLAFDTEGNPLVEIDGKYYKLNEDGKADTTTVITPATSEQLKQLDDKYLANFTSAVTGLADLDHSDQSNALTVADAQKLGWVVSAGDYAANVTNANEVRFNGSNGISVTGETDENGVRNINVSIAKGKVDGNTTTGVATGDTNYVTGDQVAKAINESGWKTNVTQTNATTNQPEIVTKVVTPGTQVNYVNGLGTNANVVTNSTTGGLDVTFDVKSANTDTLTVGKDGVKVNTGKITAADSNATITITNADGSTSTIANAERGKVTVATGEGNKVATVQNVADAINSAKWFANAANLDTAMTDRSEKGAESQAIGAGDTVTFQADKNLAVKRDGTSFTYGLAKDIEVDSVTANNRVQIGSGDTAVNLTVDMQDAEDSGVLKVAGKDGNATRITNVDAGAYTMEFNKDGDQLVQVGDKYYVVDPETGVADFTKESTLATEEELDELVKAKPELKSYVAYVKAASGLADLENSHETNALTVADAKRLGWVVSAGDYAANVTNANEVRFNGSNGISVTGETDENGVRNINVSIAKGKVDGNTTTGVATGDTNYVTGDQVAKAINESGWKTNVTNATTGLPETKVVTPGTQVDYVNGNGTTANVTLKDGKVAVSYNVNQTTGSVNPNGTATVTDGNAFLNASTVANLVNNSAFNVTTAKVDAFAENQEGKANAAVKAGGNITYTAGKNIAISQNGSNFTFSTTKDIEVDSVTANKRVQIGSGDTAVNLTTDLGALQVADKDGNATQITNVEAGTNVMAFNKEGDQLVQVGDKFYVVDPETNEVDFTKESTPATEEELDELAKAKPALKAYVAYSKAASGLADLDNSEQTNALTVADAQRLGWVVSASGNDYADSVTNANEVRFNGSNGISVTGETDEHGVRNINVSIAKGNVAGNTTTGVATGDTNYVTGDQVANAINNSGWKTTATKVVDEAGNEIVDANKATAVNPGDSVNYVDGNSTKANVVVTKAADGKETVNVSYDLVTEDHLTPVANDAKSVTKPTNIDAKGKDAATVNDVLNAGWNLQANDEAVDAVTHGNNVNFTSKDGSVKITAKSDGSTSSLDFAVNATSIVNQVAGTISYNKDGKATTNGDGKRIATVGDVANTINNTGWLTNVTDAKGNVTTKVVTPNTQVNYVNGDGTKANVVANSTTGGLDVTFNVKSANPETLTVDGNGVKVNTGSITEATDVAGDANRGKVTVAAGEGNKVATVQNVANAINSASWTVKVADTQEEITTSTANDEGSSVRAGNEITHVAGKNLKVKRDGRNVTYALANDVSVNTVTAQNSIKVGAGNAATTVTTSSAQDGVTEVKLADAAGKATRITNVAAGVKDTDAVNVSQLRNSNAQINQNIAHLNNKVNRMGKDLRAGIAGSNAAAGLPQVYIPGKSMVAAAAGTFKGQSAVAVGYSRASDNGKVILKLQGNANTRGDVGGSVGVGYQW